MKNHEVIRKELIEKWESLNIGDTPPEEAIVLASDDDCTVYVDDRWGPAVPYPPVDHGDGQINYGYRRVKGDDDAIKSIPEIKDTPEYEDLLLAINSTNSPIESVGCEKGVFPVNDHATIKVNIGSYTDVIFSDYELNREPKNMLCLASLFIEALNGSAGWWSQAEVGIQKLKGLYSCHNSWCLLLRVNGFGRTEDEARMTWATSLKKLSAAIKKIEADRFMNA